MIEEVLTVNVFEEPPSDNQDFLSVSIDEEPNPVEQPIVSLNKELT